MAMLVSGRVNVKVVLIPCQLVVVRTGFRWKKPSTEIQEYLFMLVSSLKTYIFTSRMLNGSFEGFARWPCFQLIFIGEMRHLWSTTSWGPGDQETSYQVATGSFQPREYLNQNRILIPYDVWLPKKTNLQKYRILTQRSHRIFIFFKN